MPQQTDTSTYPLTKQQFKKNETPNAVYTHNAIHVSVMCQCGDKPCRSWHDHEYLVWFWNDEAKTEYIDNDTFEFVLRWNFVLLEWLMVGHPCVCERLNVCAIFTPSCPLSASVFTIGNKKIPSRRPPVARCTLDQHIAHVRSSLSFWSTEVHQGFLVLDCIIVE